MLLTFDKLIEATLQFKNHTEFVCMLDLNDWLSLKNWMIDASTTGDVEYVLLTKEYCLQNKYISFAIDGITFHAFSAGRKGSIIGPCKEIK